MRIVSIIAIFTLVSWDTSNADDIITFKDGGSIRGKVISYKDGKLTIRGENGEIANGAMDTIQEIQFSKTPTNDGVSAATVVTNGNIEAVSNSKINSTREELACLKKVLSADYPFTSCELFGRLGNAFITVRRCADTEGRYDAILIFELSERFNKKVDWNAPDSVLGWQTYGCSFNARGITLSTSAGESGFPSLDRRLVSRWGMELDRIQRLLRSFQPPKEQAQKN